MTSDLLPRLATPGQPDAELLDRDVSEFMTPGCVVISDAASAGEAAAALLAHGVDAVLVVSAASGEPLGWVMAGHQLQRCLDSEGDRASVRGAITETVRSIAPNACARAALYALTLAATTRLLVKAKEDHAPLGVLTEIGEAVADEAI